jgi:hypothetical protein
MVEALCYKLEGRGFETRCANWISSIYLIFWRQYDLRFSQPLTGLSTRNKIEICFWGVERGRCARPTISSPSVSRLSIQWVILNISQPYRPPRPVTGIALFCTCRWRSCFTGNIPMGLITCCGDKYVDYVHTSQETQLWTFLCRWCSYRTSNTPMGIHGLSRG